jgi:hypothetical protein
MHLIVGTCFGRILALTPGNKKRTEERLFRQPAGEI